MTTDNEFDFQRGGRRIEGRLHTREHSVTVSGAKFHGWLEEAPEVGDEIVYAGRSGVVVYRITEVSKLDGGSYHGRVRFDSVVPA